MVIIKNIQQLEENVKQVLEIILHERMKTKATLEMLRFVEETNIRKSYKREIDYCLDRMTELDDLYEKIKNK